MAVKNRVIQIVSEVTGMERKKIFVEANFINDLGLDSLLMVELCMLLEDRFDFNLDYDVISFPVASVQDAINLIQAQA